MAESKLALFGGKKAVKNVKKNLFTWPIITKEDEKAVLEVLRRGGMSDTDVTMEFEKEFAAWQGVKYALGCSSGTAALQSAMYGCKVGIGDEIICPSVTYWASCLPAYSLGAAIVFAEIDPQTLCIDPKDIEHRITDRTKAIVVVHYVGHPADMDPIMAIARKHNIKVIEDVSHAHGGLYKGRKVGTIGDVSGYSLMSAKPFATGEAGIMTTNDREIYERAVAFGHYERYRSAEQIETPFLRQFIGLPLGGYKYRMHQLSSAVGRVQLKYYDERMKEIQQAMNYFWDLLEGVRGIRAHRPAKDSGSTMGGWYWPNGLYVPEELEGLSVTRFCEAVRAEGVNVGPGSNRPLHLHPLFHTCDVYGHGKPTAIANVNRDLRQPPGSLPVSESIGKKSFTVPQFKKYQPRAIAQYAKAFKKISRYYKELLKDDTGDPASMGGWSTYWRH
ncbi:MAG: DegT/DnrJ/EryC1/StrS family aminotransferase [Kiritimatiellia bacterium]|nr:DegT/DnrJ/EryC1/StrS family aminotransferase [Kiritimatiellia bacterium]